MVVMLSFGEPNMDIHVDLSLLEFHPADRSCEALVINLRSAVPKRETVS